MSEAALATSSPLTVESLLGGATTLATEPRSSLEWVAVVRRGISADAVDSLVALVGITQAELAGALGISPRTLVRRKKEGVLSSEESAKLLRLARVVVRAQEVFEDLTAALDWLTSPNAALAGATPLSLLDTDIGAEAVFDTLGRIEHGVYA